MRMLLVAGEASGDLHAANLVRELKILRPGISFFGIGGRRMESEGVELLASTEELSVVGFTEVLSKLGTVRSAMSRLYRETTRRKPGVAVLIDYPGFNLRFARLARGIVPRMFYYIGPQVWAWGGWRARTIPSLFDALLSIIPFECSYYEGTKLKCLFVGHPVLDLVKPATSREEFRAEYGVEEGALVGLAPGSRREEVKRILPIMLESAKMLKRELSGVSFAVGVAETIETGLVKSMCEGLFQEVSIVRGRTHELMQASDLALVASGTATLEAAILGVPMLIIYKMSPLTWLLARGLVKVKYVGLANIIAGRKIVPEFIQYDASPERISREVLSLLGDRSRLEEMRADLGGVRRELGSPGASRRAAELVLELSGWK